MEFEGAEAGELAEAIVQLHALQEVVHAQLLAALAAFDREEGWRQDGASGAVAWLVMALGVSHATAAAWVRTARALESLPALAGVYGEGLLSSDQLAPVLRMATPDNDAELAKAALGWSVAEACALARSMRPPVDPQPRRSLRFWTDPDDDMVHLRGRLAAEAGAAVVARIEAEAATMPPDPDSGSYEPHECRAADALVNLVRGKEGPAATVVVHADAAALAGGGGAQLEGGPGLSTDTLRRLACDGRLQVFSTGSDGTSVGVGRSRRTPPGWMVRRLRRRDGGCVFPACGRQRWLHSHHVRHWADGGPTDLDNLLTLCSYHHRVVHEGGWGVELKEGRPVFIRPDGRILTTGPPGLDPEIRRRMAG